MRITRIQAANILGVVAADVAINRPVALFAGANAAGKSSLQEAVRMALTAETVRVGLKKEYPQLVTKGAKDGFAEVTFQDGTTAFMMLPSGKVSEDYTPPKALPYVLDAQRFARLDVKERRSFLFGLMGLKVGVEDTKRRLLERKLNVGKVDLVLPLLRAGFDAASKDAATKATEAKGAWRQVTNETYGSQKAVDWLAPKPELDAAAMKEAEEVVTAADANLAAANQTLGALQAARRKASEFAEKSVSLKEKADKVERLRVKLSTDEEELQRWETQVTQLEAARKSQDAMECPCCKAKLLLKDGALVDASKDAKGTEDDLALLPQAIRSRDLLKSAVFNARRDLDDAVSAAAQLKGLEDAGKNPTDSELEAARVRVSTLTAGKTKAAADLERFKGIQRQVEAADANTTKAAGHHADVEQWDAIAKALAPDGIPADLLKEALGPINARLEQSAVDAEWPRVTISEDMDLKAGDRDYRLLSESEQWRADAMVAEAISFQSGLKFLVLDRFDVLDLKGRDDLLAWLDILAAGGEVETALIFGTLKGLPAQLPATVQAEWIHNGHVGQMKEAA